MDRELNLTPGMRFFAVIVTVLAFSNRAFAEHFTIGSADVQAPSGWTEVRRLEQRIVLRSPDGQQQATISLMRFGANVSFEDFKRLCQLRLEAEKKVSPECFVQAEPPFEGEGKFGMFYSGGDKGSGRVFSCYLSLAKRELVTFYLEGLRTDPQEHLKVFEAFVQGMTRKS